MFQAIDKFPEKDTEDYIYDSKLLYVNTFVQKYLPSFDYDYENNEHYKVPSNSIDQFIRRYNNNDIKIRFNTTDYINDKTTQLLIRSLELDPESFWYLIIFIYDYSYGACIDKTDVLNSPIEDIDQLCTMIADNIESVNPFQKPTCKEEMTLTLKIGKKTMVIDNEQTLYLLAVMGLNGTKNGKKSPFFNGRDTKTGIPDSFTIMAYCFAKLMIEFFNTQNIQRKEGANTSNVEKNLICSLLYFTQIISNKSILSDLNYYKAIMSKYKSFNVYGLNSYYWY